MLKSGDWQAIRSVRRGSQPKQGRLRDLSDKLVGTEQRAETLAEYLEKVQWETKFANEVPEEQNRLGAELPIDVSLITATELQKVLRRLKDGRSPGGDNIAAEFWKALAEHQVAMNKLLSLCNLCWQTKQVPTAWRSATVISLFKKGDTSMPSNYRPISLLAVAYKVLAALLFNRLKTGGTEGRIQESQYGFRPGRGTSDALFLARRIIDATLEDRDGQLYLLLLDWSKAFDRIKTSSLLLALQRFGLPQEVLDMVAAIYNSRTFTVRDSGKTSSLHAQSAGIAQGCPLSPYLFVIVMSVLMADATTEIKNSSSEGAKYVVTPDVFYADDTMIIGSDAGIVQGLFDSIAKVGRQYGLELNMPKTVLLRIRCHEEIIGTDGKPMQVKEAATYLGSLLSSDGRPGTELTRRLGEATSSFHRLVSVWKHANLPRSRKLEVFNACVISKLLYSLESCWLLQADRDKLDAFEARCVRKICGIQPSSYSRVPNKAVLESTNQITLSKQLLANQLHLYGKIARLGKQSYLRQLLFEQDSLTPKRWQSRRRVGRPRLQWSTCVHAQALDIAGGDLSMLQTMLDDPNQWKTAISEHCN